jgi:putative CocE/NonD family hydrolase
MSNSIRIDRDVPMATRDGVILRADIYRPDDSDKHPAIVACTQYDKSWMPASGDFLSVVNAAFAGYAVVTQDVRGRFASEGEYTPLRLPKGADGHDTVEWVAAEPWCDGNVGMFGASFLGAAQWRTAMQAPPHLKAIAPSMVQAGRVTETRRSGPMELELTVSMLAFLAPDIIDRMEKQGKDVSGMREMAERAQFNPDEVCSYLPLKDIPHFQFEGLSQLLGAWVGSEGAFAALDSEESLYWSHARVEAPCFHCTGWYDVSAGSAFENFLNMREKGGSQRAREGQHVLCGPWAHGFILPPFLGGLNFGPVTPVLTPALHDRHIAFFDRYLRGMDVDIPAVRYFVMGRDRWEDADTWPLPQTEWQRFFLHSGGRSNTAAGDGLLSRDEPGAEPPDIFVYDPRFPVPTVGGRNLPTGRLVPGPFDQTPVEKRSDVLCYTTPDLDEDLEVTGPLVLHLFAATSARDTDFTAKLVNVYPDGSAYNVAEGCIRARYRESIIQPELVNPGEVYQYCIDLAVTSVVFRRGHRIRIDISSSNFPRIDRNMNTGNAFGEDAQGVPALQTVYHQSDYPTHIDLPVIPAAR